MKRYLSVVCLCFMLTLFPKGGWALSDQDYRDFLHDSTFQSWDEMLNRTWKRAQKALSPKEFAELKKEQIEWVRQGRDDNAAMFLQENPTRENRIHAYIEAIKFRVDEIRYAMDISYLRHNPVGPQGFYLLEEKQRHGILRVYWPHQDTSEVVVLLDMSVMMSSENANTGIFEGRGNVERGVLVASSDVDPSASITVTFDGNMARVHTSEEFQRSGWAGCGVSFDGKYQRERFDKN